MITLPDGIKEIIAEVRASGDCAMLINVWWPNNDVDIVAVCMNGKKLCCATGSKTIVKTSQIGYDAAARFFVMLCEMSVLEMESQAVSLTTLHADTYYHFSLGGREKELFVKGSFGKDERVQNLTRMFYQMAPELRKLQRRVGRE